MQVREVIKSYIANHTDSEDCGGGNDVIVTLKEYSHNPQYEVQIIREGEMVESTACTSYETAVRIYHEKQSLYLGKVMDNANEHD